MKREGPQLEALLRRLVDCPPEFLETCADKGGLAQLTAIVCDHFRAIDSNSTLVEQTEFVPSIARQPANFFGLAAVACWLIHDDWFRQKKELAPRMWQMLGSDRMKQLARLVKADLFVSDPDRREELARIVLASLDLRPAGETVEQASDRMTTLDSVERDRVLRNTAAAEKRAREVREAMARARAMESASRYGE